MKNSISKLLAILLAFALCFSFVGCALPEDDVNDGEGSTQAPGGDVTGSGDGTGTSGGTVDLPIIETDEPDDLLGITDDTIWVGNTAGTTGALATIGGPFNLGIEAAFAKYNAEGGYNGMKIALKHYDDGGVATNSVSLLDKLIYEDEVFAIVGHFGSYAVDATLDTLKDEEIPMIYAAAGNGSLLNEAASTVGDRGIFPVQPLNVTEGRMLILRAFAPAADEEGNALGGLGATKVGVISNSNEASQALLSGIKAEAEQSNLTNIVYQEVASADYTGAVNALKSAGCDVVVLTVIGTDFLTALTTMADSAYYCKVLTSYNNASTAVFNDSSTTVMLQAYEQIFSTMAIYSQAWLDITSTTYVYKDETSALYSVYAAFGLDNGGTGVAGFNEEYWAVANDIYNYALTVDPTTAFAMSYDAYALAGYIAGDLFCQAMEALEASGKALSRANLVTVMESQEFQIAMADKISFANGLRAGVSSFALSQFFDLYAFNGGAYHSASSTTVHTLTSIEEYRELLK